MQWPPKQTKVQRFDVVQITEELYMLEEHIYGEGVQETAIFSKDESKLKELAEKANQAALHLLDTPKDKEETPQEKLTRIQQVEFMLANLE